MLSTPGKQFLIPSLMLLNSRGFLTNTMDKSGFKALNEFLMAYKPNKDKFAVFTGELTMEAVEMFTGSALNGDIQFTRTCQRPVLK